MNKEIAITMSEQQEEFDKYGRRIRKKNFQPEFDKYGRIVSPPGTRKRNIAIGCTVGLVAVVAGLATANQTSPQFASWVEKTFGSSSRRVASTDKSKWDALANAGDKVPAPQSRPSIPRPEIAAPAPSAPIQKSISVTTNENYGTCDRLAGFFSAIPSHQLDQDYLAKGWMIQSMQTSIEIHQGYICRLHHFTISSPGPGFVSTLPQKVISVTNNGNYGTCDRLASFFAAIPSYKFDQEYLANGWSIFASTTTTENNSGYTCRIRHYTLRK